MKCPYCSDTNSKVIDSRDAENGIRRRRECLSCARRFTTYERIDSQNLFVLKKDGRREGFDRMKLLSGLRRACEKRPLPTGAVERLAEDIEEEIGALGRAEVPSSLIGEKVMDRLKKLDHIAYIRFASVYRDFADIEELKQEVETLSASRSRTGPPSNQLPLIAPEENGAPAPRRRRGR